MQRSLLIYALVCLAAFIFIFPVMEGCKKSNKQNVILYDSDEDKSNDNQIDSTISLTFLGFKADAINLTAIENALQGFMSEYKDIKITYEGIKGLNYWEAFDKRNDSNVLDDIFMMHHDHIITMGAQGKLADLSDLPGIENYTPESKEQFTNADGSVYFLPTQISTYNLYINYDLLEKHDQSIPENWSEFQKCCDYFVDKGIVPIIANNRNSLTTLITSKGLFDVYQQPDIDEILQSYNDNPSLLADTLAPGVEQVAEMLDRGWFDAAEVLATDQTSDDLTLFLKGDRPFMITGGWASVRVIAQNPDFSYGVYPYPILDDGSVLPIQVDTCISINANSSHIEEAKKFVSYLIRPDIMWAYCDSQASYTPLKEGDRLPSEKTLIPSTEYLSNGRIVFRSEYRLNLPTETALSACAKALLNGAGLAEAQDVLAKALAK